MAADTEGAVGLPDAAAMARRLASCKPSIRYRTVHLLLTSFLPSVASISDADLLKIWKGIFFCFWHCDKPLNQANLASRLADAVSELNVAVAVPYLNAYFTTLHREWPGIDYLRLDKFYLLNRRFLRNSFLLMRKSRWDPQLVSTVVKMVSERSVLAGSNVESSARGFAYHVADSFLDEIEEFLPVENDTMGQLLGPFFTVMEKSDDRVLVGKVKSSVFKRLLENGEKLLASLQEDVEAEPSVEKLGRIGLTMGFSERFLNLAITEGTTQVNRKFLHGLHDKFFKLEKQLEKAGLEVAQPKFQDEGSDLAADDVSLAATENGGGTEDEPPLKRKKGMKSKKLAEGEVNKSEKKKKKKLKTDSVHIASGDSEMGNNSDISTPNGINQSDEDSSNIPEAIPLDETLLSNLQRQFEKVAEEAGMAASMENVKVKVGKRKRAKSVDHGKPLNTNGTDEGCNSAISSAKTAKRVRFSMNSNLVWKPHSPLPPQSLRVPPSATPRGSALKKGVPPGPVRETASIVKKSKAKVNPGKKTLKAKSSVAVKRLRKLQSLSS